jgi:hypothetical protein
MIFRGAPSFRVPMRLGVRELDAGRRLLQNDWDGISRGKTMLQLWKFSHIHIDALSLAVIMISIQARKGV